MVLVRQLQIFEY